jgi:biopolymer transport protein ExbB
MYTPIVLLLLLFQTGDHLTAPPEPGGSSSGMEANGAATDPPASGEGDTQGPAAGEGAGGASEEGAASAGDEADEAATDAENAQPAEEGDASGFSAELAEFFDSGALGLIRKGGWFMWPILIMGVIAAGVVIERYRSLKMLSTDTEQLREQTRQLLQEDRVEEALRLCDGEQGPVPAILSSGLRKYLVLRRLDYDPARIEEQVVKAMDDYGIHVVAALERHLPVLATVSSAAPMLGFLGTVAGMIVSFEDIVAQMGETNIVEAAAGGISQALLTTCFGLIVGIPAYVAYNYFTSVINRFVLDVEESATELIEAVTLQTALNASDGRPTAEAQDESPVNVNG